MDNNGIIDSNGDGIDDSIAVLPFQDLDADGDGIVDRFDVDDNNDGLSDMAEASGAAFSDDANPVLSPVVSSPLSQSEASATSTSSTLSVDTSTGEAAAATSNTNINSASAESTSAATSPTTGIGSSSGCSVSTTSRTGSLDPTLVSLFSVSIFAMLWRSRRRKLAPV